MQTTEGAVLGTPQYMAPEQATGQHLDARSDLYAVGVILYQMTTGQLPFDAPTSMEVLTRHVNEPPIPPRERAPDARIGGYCRREVVRRHVEEQVEGRQDHSFPLWALLWLELWHREFAC